jgi:enoyl-[acyl-carrier-protein] reductase (NADH)
LDSYEKIGDFANPLPCPTHRGNKFPEAKVKATTEKSALKATASPEDVAEQIRTLVLSKSMTGQNIVMDCGIAI